VELVTTMKIKSICTRQWTAEHITCIAIGLNACMCVSFRWCGNLSKSNDLIWQCVRWLQCFFNWNKS